MSPKTTLITAGAVFAGLFATLSANAQTTISVDFIGGSGSNGTPAAMSASETAGVAIGGTVRNNWNSISGGSGTGVAGLVTDDGSTLATTTLSFSSGGTWSTGVSDTPGNNRMMKGFLDGTNTAFSLTNLPFAGAYDLYIYFDGDNGGAQRNADFALSGVGAGYGVDSPNVNFGGAFVQATGNSDVPGSNYIVYTGLTGSSVSIAGIGGFSSDGTIRAPINGFQLAGNIIVVPEASTLVLLVGAGLSAVVFVKRRRTA